MGSSRFGPGCSPLEIRHRQDLLLRIIFRQNNYFGLKLFKTFQNIIRSQFPLVHIEEELEVLLTHVHDVVSPKLGLRERNQKEKKGGPSGKKEGEKVEKKNIGERNKKRKCSVEGCFTWTPILSTGFLTAASE